MGAHLNIIAIKAIATLVFLGTSGSAYAALLHVPQDVQEVSWRLDNLDAMVWYDVVESAVSPQDIAESVHAAVEYREDIGEDEWTSGKETWTRGYGDCEDIAACVMDLCREVGIRAEIHIYYPGNGDGQGHAVTVGKWNGKWWMSSNGDFEWMLSLAAIKRRHAEKLNAWERDIEVVRLPELPTNTDNRLRKVFRLGSSPPSHLQIGEEGRPSVVPHVIQPPRVPQLPRYDPYYRKPYVGIEQSF
jgi:hypothetical protein